MFLDCSMRRYESGIICLVFTFLVSYFDKEFGWIFFLVCGIFIAIPFLPDASEEKNEDRRWIYAIIAFLYNPVFTYMHYENNMPIYGMNPSDFTDVFSMIGRAIGAFAFVVPLGLLTLLFKPKRKWETYWLVTMIISIIMGSWVISSNSF